MNAGGESAKAGFGGQPSAAAESTLEIVRDLALELHSEWRRTLIVELDSDLDRDLGYDSLGRAELLLRLSRAFGVVLSERLIGEAATPRDLADAVRAAAPQAGRLEPREAVCPIMLPDTPAPLQAGTLTEVLAAHVRSNPNRPHVYFWRSEAREDRMSYAQLDRAARRVAHGLLGRGIGAGARVAIMLPSELAFFHAFFGALMAGAIPVPLYPPFRPSQVEDHLRRQAGILRNAGARILVTDEHTRRAGALLHGLVGSLDGVDTVAQLSGTGEIAEPLPLAAHDTALIQYTSGSTGDPKGVVLSHANLLANLRAMGETMEASSTDIFVSWLPLYHDMGLIGAWLGPLYYGAPVVIMSPLAFIADPARWLWAMHRRRATLSAAPNFAFELCLKRVRNEDLKGLDLSSLRMVVNGAETVSPRTISRFTERFAKYGFRAEALAPVYGLAENAVGLAFPPPGRAPIVERVERKALSERGVATPAKSDDVASLEFVACGQPLTGHQIRIVDATGHEAPERREGRLQFKGPSATRGYFQSEETTRTLFDGDWLDSGDLAYIARGDIYITGRVKDVIIRAGRNIYPHELEECVGNVEGVRKGCVAVFACGEERTGTERLVVLAETRLAERPARDELRRRIYEALSAVVEIPPEEVALAPPRTVPKTSSGKIRRSAARALYEAGAAGRPSRAVWWQLTRLTLAGAGIRLLRGLGTLGEFAYAAYWWALLCLACAVLWPLVMALPRRRWRHSAIGGAFRVFLRLVGTPLKVEAETAVPAGGAILAPNHGSYLDGGVVSAAIPGPLTFVVAERFSRHFVAGSFLRRIGTAFIEGGAEQGLAEKAAALAAVRSGERVVVFPEGRVRRVPGLLSFFMGPFVVAAEAAVPVIPVTIRGTRSVLRDGGQWFPRRGRITVHIGKPIHPVGGGFEAAIRLREAVRREIQRRCGEPDLAREPVDFGS